MKKLFVAMVFCISGVVIAAKGDTYTKFDYQIKKKERIPLKGDIGNIGVRSISEVIVAFLEENSISAFFTKDLGTVTVSIADQSARVVYSSIVNSTIGTVAVPISILPSGIYTITFSNGDGSMWGKFEHDM